MVVMARRLRRRPGSLAAVLQHDRFADHAPELRHARGEPLGDAATVQRQIGTA
jgi:hypothetical protein